MALAFINLEDDDEGAYTVRLVTVCCATYMATKSCLCLLQGSQFSPGSPAQVTAKLLMQHADTLGERIALKEDVVDETLKQLEETEVPSAIITEQTPPRNRTRENRRRRIRYS